MTFIAKLEEAYKTQNWDEVGEVLQMLGVEVMSVTDTPKKKSSKKAVQPAPVPNNRIDMQQFMTTGNKAAGWEEIPKHHTNTFVDDRADINLGGPYRPQYKGKRPKGVKAEYPSYEDYLKEVVYPKNKAKKNTRPSVNKVDIVCSKCHQTHKEYPGSIRYANVEDKVWYCNTCITGKN